MTQTNSNGQARPVAASLDHVIYQFGSQRALDDVSLHIPTGSVFGILGLNGAGKTTLLHHLLGLHQPRSGRIEVLGGNPIVNRESVMRQVGYLSEEDSLPAWMSVQDVLRFHQAIYPTWDRSYADELLDWFELDLRARLKTLSKGGRARVGLIAAIAHRPELLILDEPSSGLDPIARGEILEAIIRAVSIAGRTVIFSSHLLDEVQRVCDRVAVIHQGRVIEQFEMATLHESFQEWIVRPQSKHINSSVCPFDDALDWRGIDGEWSAVRRRAGQDDLSQNDWQVVDTRSITLERLFEALVGRSKVSTAPSETHLDTVVS
ncbi:MAG: ABC transporter ATP-binding protein [Planctomycetota bacterium]